MRLVLLVAFAARFAAAQDSSASPVSLVDRAAQQYRAATTVRASFDQALTVPGAASQASRGEYFQGSGSRFALRFSDPAGDAVVNDGTSLWLYLPSSAKGQVIKMKSGAGTKFDLLGELLSAPKADYRTVRVRDETLDGHATTVYTLSPKKADLPFTRATLWIGQDDAIIWQLETVEPGGMDRKVRFSSVQIGGMVPADEFAFVVPAGVRVIDQAALFGKKP
ncbi:MAG: outer membrane lipoprotein carrier protein LolA [Gemmatimonadales bacterium]